MQGKQKHFKTRVYNGNLKDTTKLSVTGFSNKENFYSKRKQSSLVPLFIAEGLASVLCLHFLVNFIYLNMFPARSTAKTELLHLETFTQ